jgi:HNH endonuclease
MSFLTMAATPNRHCSRRCARSKKTEDRFWPKVAKSDGCWEWQGSRDHNGYGILGASRHQRARRAHRVSWELHHGPIPEGLDALHHCDNPPCVRPDHLYLGTDVDNARDRVQRGRAGDQLGQANGNAKLTEADVRAIIAALQAGSTQQAAADRFGISQPHVSKIARRKAWSWSFSWDA